MAVGERISQLRQAKNLTIEQVASATRLRKDVISLIESEQWDKLDLPVFIRNQIRLIAVALNADESELLQMFEQDLPGNVSNFTKVGQTKSTELNIFDKHGKSALPAKRNPKWLYLIFGTLVILAVAIFAYTTSSNAENTLPESDITISESPTSSESASPNPTDEPSTLGVSVVLQASGRSWITATGSTGNSLFSSFLNANDTITLTDSTSIYLVIGDAGMVNVTVNDENLGFLGGPGTPVEISFPVE